MSRPSSLARNVVSNWAGIALSIVYALVITPVVVRALDTGLYGVWSFLNGLLAYSELFYLGLGSALIRYVAQASAEHDHARINRLTSVVLSIYTLIGVVCVLLALLLAPWVPTMFAEPLAPDAARAAVYTCVLLGVRLLLVFVGTAFSGLMCGHDRFDLVNAVTMSALLVRFIAIPVFVHAGQEPLLTMAILMGVVSAIETAALAGIAFWYVPGLSAWPARPRLGELKLLYGFGLQSFFVLAAFKLISYTDTTIIGVQLGAASVALYSLPLQLVEYARACVGGFSGVLLPRLTILSAQADLPRLREAYLSSARIGSFIAGWLGAVVITLGPSFLSRWVGQEFGAASQAVLVWLSLAAFAQALSTQVPYPFYQSLHMLVFPAIVLTIEGVINLVLSILLAPVYGIAGVALATAVPAVLISLVLLPAALCRRLELPLRTFASQGALPGVLMFAAALATQVLFASVMPPAESYAMLAGRAIVTLPVALAVFAWTFPREERRELLRTLRISRGDNLGPSK